MKLVKPDINYKKAALEYIEEFYKYNSNINGDGGLTRYLSDYSGWLKKLEDDRNCIANLSRVPAETYFLVREGDDYIIGMINIRLELNDKLKKIGGNIGYSIRPTERRKGYNKINLYLGLLKCSEYGLKNVILDCDEDNLGSKKTIEALGGVLNRRFYSDIYSSYVLSYNIDVEESIKKNIKK